MRKASDEKEKQLLILSRPRSGRVEGGTTPAPTIGDILARPRAGSTAPAGDWRFFSRL
jgi:hypothetical protein